MTQKVPVIPAISNDVPLNTRRVLLAMKTTIEYLLTQTGDRTVAGATSLLASGGGGGNHNSLTGLQGGATNDFYHLTQAALAALTDGGNTTLHHHDTDRDLTLHTGVLPWAQVDKTGASLGDFPSLDHEGLSTFQGGQTGEHYHLTLSQWAFLLQGVSTALHYHDADRARVNHTGVQTADTIQDQMNFAQILAFAAAQG